MDEAFTRLRSYARNNNRGLTEVAESLVAGNDQRRVGFGPAAHRRLRHRRSQRRPDSLAVRSYGPLSPERFQVYGACGTNTFAQAALLQSLVTPS